LALGADVLGGGDDVCAIETHVDEVFDYNGSRLLMICW
jgi:hypothetical protein